MIKAKLNDGTVILGLDEENIKRLKENQPIVADLSEIGINQKIVIMYGETLGDIKAELGRHFSTPSKPGSSSTRMNH